jgi:uncharacterized 2Fe-2S/4Fe-4S cluster protein (DUF4445 family)
LQYSVEFEPIGRRGTLSAEASLLEAAQQLGVQLISLCGGRGSCGRCKLQLLDGELSPPTEQEAKRLTGDELSQGFRLACQAFPLSDVKLSVPPSSLSTPQRTQVEGQDIPVTADPLVHAYPLQLTAPSLEDLIADAERVQRALQEQHGVHCSSVDVGALHHISPRLREWNWSARAVLRNGECVAYQSPQAPLLGLAIDLGTTKVAGYLIDLAEGRTVASQGLMNPQISYGEDVVTRIGRALESPEEAQRMQALAVEAIARLGQDLTATVGAQAQDIVDAVVVGNTAMHHLLLRLPVEQLVMAPYVPAVASALDVKARDLDLPFAGGAYVHLLPNIAGYVGADHVAMILGTELWRMTGVLLAMDIGTNTEICLGNHGRLSSVSCASGPAFEGAHIKHGMRAAAGAIEQLRWANDHLEYHTVGDAPPVGMCGSGILDALAQLHARGIIDRTGRMLDHSRVRTVNGQREFVIVDRETEAGPAPITLTQHDVRELQLAKGAIRTGITALLLESDLSDEDIDEVIIAGAFGSYIDVSSAITIGMLPALPLQRFRQVGNAAGTGARLALMSREQRAIAAEIGRLVHYIELASLPEFSDLFAQSTFLGEYRIRSPA